MLERNRRRVCLTAALGVLVLLLTGCTPLSQHLRHVSLGPMVPPPTLPDAGNAALIVVGRDNRVAGFPRTFPVMLDGVRVYRLRVGEHAVMKVDPGDHIVGTQYMGLTFAWEDVTVLLRAEPGHTYYFRIDPGSGHPLLNAIPPDAGRALMSNTTRISEP